MFRTLIVHARSSHAVLIAIEVEASAALSHGRVKDYEVLYMVDPLDEICSQSIVDYEAGCRLLNGHD